jgi:hypothetical protein
MSLVLTPVLFHELFDLTFCLAVSYSLDLGQQMHGCGAFAKSAFVAVEDSPKTLSSVIPECRAHFVGTYLTAPWAVDYQIASDVANRRSQRQARLTLLRTSISASDFALEMLASTEKPYRST